MSLGIEFKHLSFLSGPLYAFQPHLLPYTLEIKELCPHQMIRHDEK